MKLNDLSYILEAYESLLEGRYQDGDSEFNAAVLRARDAAFLKDCDVWFFGFDMVPPTLHELMAAVAASTERCGVFLPLENDEQARDFDAFQPMQKSLERLAFAAKRQQAAVERIDIEETRPVTKRRTMLVPGAKRKSDLAALERELFAYPASPASGAAKAVQLTLLRNPLEECMFAAALVRRLAIRRGWRYSDVLLLCRDVESYAAPLRTAFAAYDVPLFVSSSRPAARHATADPARAVTLEEVRWLIEELRVSLFAQQLGTPVKVSEKRIRKLLATA